MQAVQWKNKIHQQITVFHNLLITRVTVHISIVSLKIIYMLNITMCIGICKAMPLTFKNIHAFMNFTICKFQTL